PEPGCGGCKRLVGCHITAAEARFCRASIGSPSFTTYFRAARPRTPIVRRRWLFFPAPIGLNLGRHHACDSHFYVKSGRVKETCTFKDMWHRYKPFGGHHSAKVMYSLLTRKMVIMLKFIGMLMSSRA